MTFNDNRWAIAKAPRPGLAEGDMTVSMRQVVAYNLGLARKQRHMTQEELGSQLATLTGKDWSRATVSAAESGWDTRPDRRVRHFEVNDIAAFCVALRVPLTWFFLPPTTRPDGRKVRDDEPWITVTSDQGGDWRMVMSTDFLRWMARAESDENDPDDLMARRMRRDGLEPATREGDAAVDVQELGKRLNELESVVKKLGGDGK